jgi:hypothetical protein
MADQLTYTRYRLSLENSRLSRPLTGKEFETEARKRAPAGRLSIDVLGDKDGPGPELSNPDGVRRFITVTQNSNFGDKVRAIPKDGRYLRAIKVHVKPEVMDTSGNARVDKAHTLIVASWKGKVESWGICNCRQIAGTSAWSQHAYCNAEDWHASSTIMGEMARLLVRRAVSLDTYHVIHDRRIWTRGSGWHAYGGSDPHTDHVHVDFAPQGVGYPACA